MTLGLKAMPNYQWEQKYLLLRPPDLGSVVSGSGQLLNPLLLPEDPGSCSFCHHTLHCTHPCGDSGHQTEAQCPFQEYPGFLNFFCVLRQEWLEKVTGQAFLESSLASISINE